MNNLFRTIGCALTALILASISVTAAIGPVATSTPISA